MVTIKRYYNILSGLKNNNNNNNNKNNNNNNNGNEINKQINHGGVFKYFN